MKSIFYNGNVYTGSMPLSSAFAVEGGNFVAVGNDEKVLGLAADGDELIDLEGHFVSPGFNDSHMHLLNYGQTLSMVQMQEHTGSLGELIEATDEFRRSHSFAPGEWILGRGWNQDYFSDTSRMPDRHDFDRVSEDIPIAATRCCGHCLVVNTAVLKLLNITADTPSPEGGRIGMCDGEPDGRFYDAAMDIVHSAMPLPDKETLKKYIKAASEALNSYGVTSSQTDDYCVFRKIPYETVNEAFRELEESGELTVRVYEQSNFENIEALKDFIDHGNITGAGSDMFRIGPLKMLGDGSLGARTAFMSVPYSDDPSTRGIPVFSQETLDEMIGYAHSHGMQVAIHSIGDGCLDRVLSAIEKALTEHPRDDHRHGIVHCQISRADQLDKIAALDLHVYAQSIFLDYDTHIVEARVGKERASTSYSWKTLMKKGVSVSNGTDCPVELPDALKCMQCGITRRSVDGSTEPYLPWEAFTVKEALDSYTIRSAEGSFEEDVKGLIKPGYMADFVILGQNPFTVDAEGIKDIPVLKTYLGGKKVFG